MFRACVTSSVVVSVVVLVALHVVPLISAAPNDCFRHRPRNVLRWTFSCHPQKAAAVWLQTVRGGLHLPLFKLLFQVPIPQRGNDWAQPAAARVPRALRPGPTGPRSQRLHPTKSCRHHLVTAPFYGRRQQPAVPPSAEVRRSSASHGVSPAPKPTWQPASIRLVAPRRLPVLCQTPARSHRPTARAPGAAHR